MKLHLTYPSHRLSIDLIMFAKSLKLMNLIEYRPYKTFQAIVVANGSPDNRVILILAHHLNGSRVVDLIFPEYKSLSLLNYIHEYCKRGYKHIHVLVDQENMDINEIVNYTRKNVIGLKSLYVEQRVIKGEISINHLFNSVLSIIINGIDEYRVSKHTIEDHLLYIAQKLGYVSIKNNTTIDPKRVWNSLDKEKQVDVFKTVLKNKQLFREAFKQHIKAFEEVVLSNG